MAASINFPDLNQITWQPIHFDVAGGQFAVKQTDLSFRGGMKLGLSPLFKNYKDVSFNRKTGLILSNLINSTSAFEVYQHPSIEEPLRAIETPVATSSYPYDNVVSVQTTNTSSGVAASYLQQTTRAAPNTVGYPVNISANDTLKFIFVRDEETIDPIADKDLVMVETPSYNRANSKSPHKFLLTWDTSTISSTGSSVLRFAPRKFPESITQKFAYILSEDGICLFVPNTSFRYFVGLDSTTTSKIFKIFPWFVDTGYPGRPLPTSGFLKFISYKHRPIEDREVSNSHITKYTTSKLDYRGEITPDPITNASPFLQNYLGQYAFEYPKLKDGRAVYELNIHGLKNYQTPEYNYSMHSDYVGGFSGIQRVYESIFTGTNQDGGLDKVHLGYQAFGVERVFIKDKETPFSYAPTAERTPIQNVGLIEDGAVAGHHPFVSDRIYARQIDYKDTIVGLPQPPSISINSNTWLGAWLSGSNTGDKVWLDRFYNSAYYTFDQALSAQVMLYNDRLDPNQNYVYDVPSTLYMEPGAFYKYFHVGPETNLSYIPYLDGAKNSSLGSKVLEITDWSQSPLMDSSVYNHNGIVHTNRLDLQNSDYWELDGTTHAVFPARTNLLETRHFTTSLWVNVEDWNDIQGSQIFGNYYNSGYGLINNSAMTAPLFTMVDRAGGQIFSLNYQNKITNISNLPTTRTAPISSTNFITIRLFDFSYWIFDTNNAIGYKYDVDNILIKTYKGTYGITQIEVDDTGVLYLYQNSKQQITKISSDGVFIDNVYLKNKNTRRIEIFKYKTANTRTKLLQVLEIYGNCSTIDNDGNVWQSLGNNIYKTAYNSLTDTHGTPTMFATVGPVQQITCDSSNNVWILHDQDSISRIDSFGIIKTTRIGKRANVEENICIRTTETFRYINFVKTPIKGCTKFSFQDLAVIIDARDKELYMMDMSGDLIARTDLSTLDNLNNFSPVFCASGDFSGFQFLRKFYKFNKSLSWKLKIGYPSGTSLEDLTLTCDTTILKPGWHHFVLNFDTENHKANFYIDAVLMDSKIIPDNKHLYFTYRSSLLLGADSVKNSTLNDVVLVQDAYKFIGKVADLRIYNKSLEYGDIEQLYLCFKFSDSHHDLVWNMPSGNRHYVEEIEHWFKMQLPGSKSKYYNINIHNFNGDEKTKKYLESAIKQSVYKISPAHMSLYKINWI
jgi:hypothetical protein